MSEKRTSSFMGTDLSPEADEALTMISTLSPHSESMDRQVKILQAWALGEYLLNSDSWWYETTLMWIKEASARHGG